MLSEDSSNRPTANEVLDLTLDVIANEARDSRFDHKPVGENPTPPKEPGNGVA